jgi:hypothetical protein
MPESPPDQGEACPGRSRHCSAKRRSFPVAANRLKGPLRRIQLDCTPGPRRRRFGWFNPHVSGGRHEDDRGPRTGLGVRDGRDGARRVRRGRGIIDADGGARHVREVRATGQGRRGRERHARSDQVEADVPPSVVRSAGRRWQRPVRHWFRRWRIRWSRLAARATLDQAASSPRASPNREKIARTMLSDKLRELV